MAIDYPNRLAGRTCVGRALRTSTILAGLMVALPGAAQAQDQGASEAPAQGVYQAADASQDEIVITARKREEAALDVPMSVSVLTGERLEDLGARNLRDVGSLFPGVSFNDSNGSGGEFSIRGLTSAG